MDLTKRDPTNGLHQHLASNSIEILRAIPTVTLGRRSIQSTGAQPEAASMLLTSPGEGQQQGRSSKFDLMLARSTRP